MSQNYTPDMSEGMIEPKEEYKRANDRIESDESIGDTYDIYDMVSRVHSPMPEITRDFTLAKLPRS